MANEIVVLLVEDNPADVFLVREAMRVHGLNVTLKIIRDGEEAIRFIEAAEQNPDTCLELALLDLNLPRKNGLEVAACLRRSAIFARIPIAIFSSSRSPRNTLTLKELDIDHFFNKPSDFDEFMVLGGIVKSLLRR